MPPARRHPLLDRHHRGRGYLSSDDLARREVRALSVAVESLSEPLTRLTAALSA